MTTTSRWRRKWERDHLTDGWSPIPTQIVSNEEYVPMPPTREQRRVADGCGRRRACTLPRSA